VVVARWFVARWIVAAVRSSHPLCDWLVVGGLLPWRWWWSRVWRCLLVVGSPIALERVIPLVASVVGVATLATLVGVGVRCAPPLLLVPVRLLLVVPFVQLLLCPALLLMRCDVQGSHVLAIVGYRWAMGCGWESGAAWASMVHLCARELRHVAVGWWWRRYSSGLLFALV